MCYGRNLATGQFVKLGEAVGIIAAQSIGEPGTQLTMRTFHIGGTASQTFKQPIIKAKNDGTIQFNDLRTVQALDGSWIVLNKNGSISVHNAEGRELERYNVVIGSVISEGGRRRGEEGRDLRAMGSVQRSDSDRQKRQDRIPRHDRGRHDQARRRRSDRSDGHRHHRAQGRFASADRHHGRQEGSARELFHSGRRARHRRRGPKGSRRRIAGQDAAKSCKDKGHHRRSAARGRIVRSAPSERRSRDREDRRRRRNGRNSPRQTRS